MEKAGGRPQMTTELDAATNKSINTSGRLPPASPYLIGLKLGIKTATPSATHSIGRWPCHAHMPLITCSPHLPLAQSPHNRSTKEPRYLLTVPLGRVGEEQGNRASVLTTRQHRPPHNTAPLLVSLQFKTPTAYIGSPELPNAGAGSPACPHGCLHVRTYVRLGARQLLPASCLATHRHACRHAYGARPHPSRNNNTGGVRQFAAWLLRFRNRGAALQPHQRLCSLIMHPRLPVNCQQGETQAGRSHRQAKGSSSCSTSTYATYPRCLPAIHSLPVLHPAHNRPSGPPPKTRAAAHDMNARYPPTGSSGTTTPHAFMALTPCRALCSTAWCGKNQTWHYDRSTAGCTQALLCTHWRDGPLPPTKKTP